MREKLNILFNLKAITFKFFPGGVLNKSIRSFMPLTANSRVKKLSPDCKIEYVLTEQECEPEIKVKYFNGFEQSIFTQTMDLSGIIDTIQMKKNTLKIEDIKKLPENETTLEEILTPVTKKKDSGAKQNLQNKTITSIFFQYILEIM
ncbi:ribosomal protein L53 [Cavenderia fasciculata]|uniref:Ribosomal protein L53 n=1 Tax=Cavenderia fasciculata TaxID=261658 RepID=F4Q5F2_CACFS|nr:ribosomal protein L53 [Cavenderia fasciculata]EGG17211.1 ribosomal protein L53 [Cavenderia fasciculata]|eukprot:XP_004355695.1 ribosomal protein L53 [Cavenderia fasciculata]